MKRCLSLGVFLALLQTTLQAQVLVPDVALRYLLRESGVTCIDDNGILDTLCAADPKYSTLFLQDLIVGNYNGLQFFKNLKDLQITYAGSRPRVAEATDIRKYAPAGLESIFLITYAGLKISPAMLPASCKMLEIYTSPFSPTVLTVEIPGLLEGLETLRLNNQPFPIHGHYSPWKVKISGALPSSLNSLELYNIKLEIPASVAPPTGLKRLFMAGGSLSSWCGNEAFFNQLESVALYESFYEPLQSDCDFYYRQNLKEVGLYYLDGARFLTPFREALPQLTNLQILTFHGIENASINFNQLLPDNLRTLIVENSKFPSASNLPSSLRSLTLSYTQTNDLGQVSFPDNLDSITLFIADFQQMENLPEKLRYLYLYGVTISKNWNEVKFPAHLQSLSLINIPIYQLDSLLAPVKYLKLQGNSLNKVSRLPASLEELDVNYQWELTELQADLTTLPLRKLYLSNISLKVMPNLPITLESLRLQNLYSLKCVRKLPTELKELEWDYSCIPNETNYLKDGYPYPLCENPENYLCPESDPEIRGRLYLDVNDNFTYDEGDLPLSFRTFMIDPIKRYVTTKEDGTFDFSVPFYGDYYINFYNYNDHWRSYSYINVYGFSPLYSGFSGDSLIMPFKQIINEKDIEVVEVADQAVPGEETTVDIIVSDRGNPPTEKASLYLNIPDLWEVVDVTPTPTYAGPNQVGWKNIKPKLLERTSFRVRLSVPKSLKPNTAYQLSAKLEDMIDDSYPENNQFIIPGRLLESKPDLIKTVDKTFVEKQDYQDSELYYMISYQNNSFDTVTHLTISDSLSGFLFKQNYRIIGASHDYKLQMKGEGVMEFTLDNIAIPPYSTDSRNARFWVVFSIQLGFQIPSGSEIINEFQVSEQFSYPSSSNVVSTLVGFKTSVQNQQTSPLKIFPNPTNDQFKVDWENDESFQIQIIDINGRIVAQYLNHYSSEYIPVGKLASGLYLIKAHGSDKSALGRLVVK